MSGNGDGWTFEVEGPVRAMTVGHDRVIVSTDWAYWVIGEGDDSGGTTADGGSDTTTSTDGSTADGSDFESTENAERKRGLLSNGGDEPEFISDGMNLTMLGFLLSVVGILHQMTQGR